MQIENQIDIDFHIGIGNATVIFAIVIVIINYVKDKKIPKDAECDTLL